MYLLRGGSNMPTIDEVTKILSNMDKDTYGAAVRFIYYLASTSQRDNSYIENQKKFISESAGKILIDEEAITNLRMGSMI